ncbi:MAG TPA: site-specific integrase, partial [Candidatus Dormibacteraeota bacterium]|nr:site-specific integrase [Candidatus Dormibacteraeota bacterium]
MSKRAHGEGTIYKRKDGRWAAVLTVEGGRRKFLYAKTQAEAVRRLAEARRARDVGVVADDRVTVREFLERWLRDTVRPNVQPWTYRGYEVHVRVHIVPELGRLRLTALTPQHVQRWMNGRLEAGLSPKSVRYMRGTLRAALNQAVRWGMVGRNAAALVDPPRSRTVYEAQPMTVEEARRFLVAIRGHRLEALYVVALALGLRQAEILGLTWGDVDLEAGMLQVRRTLQRVEGRYRLLDVKTRLSRRELAMPRMVVERLQVHRARQEQERAAAGARWGNDLGLVFTTVRGDPLNGAVVTHAFQRVLEGAGLRRMRFHDLRHSCDTFLQA